VLKINWEIGLKEINCRTLSLLCFLLWQRTEDPKEKKKLAMKLATPAIFKYTNQKENIQINLIKNFI